VQKKAIIDNKNILLFTILSFERVIYFFDAFYKTKVRF